eukprot:2364249-Rhodomonas_salina.3
MVECDGALRIVLVVPEWQRSADKQGYLQTKLHDLASRSEAASIKETEEGRSGPKRRKAEASGEGRG